MPARDNLLDLDARRVCIIKPSAFGCVVQALPLLNAVRQRFPAAAISWVIRDDLQDLLAGHPGLAECLVYQRRRGTKALAQLLKQLRSRKFDVAIDLQGLLRSGLMTLATCAPVRIGLETAREGASLACNVVIKGTGRDVPAADRYWRVAEELGVGPCPRAADVFVGSRDRAWARSVLAPLPRPVIGVHAGAMWETKRCPPELFANVLRRTRDKFGGSIVLIGAPDDGRLAHQLRSLLANSPRSLASNRAHGAFRGDLDCLDLAGVTTLKQLAALLSGVDALLCNDSGPMHLAAAVGTPVVGLFTCTSPRLSGPQEMQHQLLSADVACAAGYHKACPWRGAKHLQCHRQLPVDRICDALAKILAPAPQELLPVVAGCRPVAA